MSYLLLPDFRMLEEISLFRRQENWDRDQIIGKVIY